MSSSAQSSLITLTTDFGLQDPFTGQIKGVILKINPNAHIIDLTHGIPRHDVQRAALVIGESHRYFPRGTVHVAVVDPGVGSERRPLIVEAGGHMFVGPDNGIFTAVFKAYPEVTLTCIDQERFLLKGPGGTFHGRDLFAPVAALLSLGERPSDMGKPSANPTVLELPTASIGEDGSLTGEVVHIDIFGNAITNIRIDELKKLGSRKNLSVSVKGSTLNIANHYAAVPDNAPHCLVNSDGCLEIFIYQGDASSRLGIVPGTKVTVFKG